MATTRGDIKRWFLNGLRMRATHLVIVTDTFDYGDFPVYVERGQDAMAVVKKYRGEPMHKVMEVYKLSDPLDEQLNRGRCFNL